MRYNPQLVGLERVEGGEDRDLLRNLITKHQDLTKSERSKEILEHWGHYLPLFWKVSPLSAAGKLSIAKLSQLMEEPSEEVTAAP